MPPFNFLRRAAPLPKSELTSEERELVDVSEANGVTAGIEAAMAKQMSWADYQAFDGMGDQGNFFGQEFELRASAMRIKGLYTREPWIFTTAYRTALTLSNVPFRAVTVGDLKPVSNHPLERLVNAGGPLHTDKECKINGYLDMMLGGTGFLIQDEAYTSNTQQPFETIQRIELFKPGEGKMGIKELVIGNQQEQSQKVTISWEYFVALKFPNPFNPFLGLSPFTAAARPILLDRYKNEFEMAFYLRGCTHAGAVETTQDMSKARLKRLIATFEQAYTGRRNWWRPVFLPKGASMKSTSFSMADMQHLEGLRENRKTILAVMGVPPVVAGLTEDANRAISEQQDAAYYRNTIIPMAQFVASAWNRSEACRKLGKGRVIVQPDFDDIDAVHGSDLTKGERAKALQPFFTINEIRSRVWKTEPLPGGIGDTFAAAGGAGSPAVQLALVQNAGPAQLPAAETQPEKAALPPVAPDAAGLHAAAKAVATSGQNRVEVRLGKDYHTVLAHHLTHMLTIAAAAVRAKGDPRKDLDNDQAGRMQAYELAVKPVLATALERGYALALASTRVKKAYLDGAVLKSYLAPVEEVLTGGETRAFDDVDQLALDVLRDKSRSAYQGRVAKRAVDAFSGFDRQASDQILGLIEDGYAKGQGFGEIADSLQATYGERYSGQAQTIVRTEILSAVSVGLKWNQDLLGQVFTEVEKQWLTQGDGGSNTDAREEHAAWEELGAVPTSHLYQSESGAALAYPRDEHGDASNVVNCRCSMINVIPDTAQSNAQRILDQE